MLFANKIFPYVQEYAKKIGVDLVLMGNQHNDVSPKNTFGKYKQNLKKLGGTNLRKNTDQYYGSGII